MVKVYGPGFWSVCMLGGEGGVSYSANLLVGMPLTPPGTGKCERSA